MPDKPRIKGWAQGQQGNARRYAQAVRRRGRRAATAAIRELSGTTAVDASAEAPQSAQPEATSVIPNTVLYESFDGNGALCNPEALFRELISSPEFAHLSHTWVLSDLAQYVPTLDEFRRMPNVHVVERRSDEYELALKTSQYLINNSTFSPNFRKRDGQIYINTWHGTPLKKMGYDTSGGFIHARNATRNFLSADYLLSSSPYMTEKLFLQGYGLNNIYKGKIIEAGTPRIDRQFLTGHQRQQAILLLKAHGVALDDRKVLLYAPTWKGQSFNAPVDDSYVLKERVRALEKTIDTSKYRILLKIHQRSYLNAVDDPDFKGILAPNDIPTNAILGLTDVLITDYSSVFFDFLATERPVLFFTPDFQQYTAERGLYVEQQEWPGPVSTTLPQLADHINALDTGSETDPLITHRERYLAAKERFCPDEDGQASARIIDIVFRGNESGHKINIAPRDGRETLLIYMGGMKSNGITTSALNLLDNLDYDRFDVTAFFGYSDDPDRLKNMLAIDPRARALPRIGRVDAPAKDRELLEEAYRGTRHKGAEAAKVRRMLADEWHRSFGNAEFDYIVDFSGYSAFWPMNILPAPGGRRSIWLHNDLAADAKREINGERPHEENLKGIFRLYKQFDSLVSVSAELSEINQSKLASYAPARKFAHAMNTINHDRIRQMAYGEDYAALHSDAHQSDDAAGQIEIATGSISEALDGLLKIYEIDRVEQEIGRRIAVRTVLPPVSKDTITFVTVGRLSPEKNHRRLLRAFRLVHEENPKTRLVIIGDGPQSRWLHKLVRNYDLEGSVIFAGHQDNPYAIMAECDCFVLSSDYEGQPMVILEARVLGLPVISTDFASVRGALPPGVGLVVPMKVKKLAEAMAEMLHGKVPNPPFDYAAYNAEAIEQFYRAIGAGNETKALDSGDLVSVVSLPQETARVAHR